MCQSRWQNIISEGLPFRAEETGPEWRRGPVKVTQVADGSSEPTGEVWYPSQSPSVIPPAA